MATERFIYNIFWKNLLSGGFDIDDKSYKAILLDPEYTFSNNHTAYDDVSLYELPAKGGYTSGGIPAKLTLAVDSYGRQIINCDALSWRDINGTLRYLTIYEAISKNLVCTLDLGTASAAGSRVDLSFPGGLFAIKDTGDKEHISHKIDIYKTLKVESIPLQPAADTIYYRGDGPGFYLQS